MSTFSGDLRWWSFTSLCFWCVRCIQSVKMQTICYYGLITATFFILIKKYTVVLCGEKLTVGAFFFLEHEYFAHCQKNYFVLKKNESTNIYPTQQSATLVTLFNLHRECCSCEWLKELFQTCILLLISMKLPRFSHFIISSLKIKELKEIPFVSISRPNTAGFTH